MVVVVVVVVVVVAGASTVKSASPTSIWSPSSETQIESMWYEPGGAFNGTCMLAVAVGPCVLPS